MIRTAKEHKVGVAAPAAVLASASPRRLDLLGLVGVEPVVRPSDIDETPKPGEAPVELVERLALTKARHVSETLERTELEDRASVVIAADTVIDLDGEVLGKPADDGDAMRMLRLQRGRAHDVLTGVAVVVNGGHGATDSADATGSAGATGTAVAVARTTVWLRPYTDDDIDWYVASGEPVGKAGAYAIQGRGSFLVERIEGNYQTVVGLPLPLLDELLGRFDLTLRDLAIQGPVGGNGDSP